MSQTNPSPIPQGTAVTPRDGGVLFALADPTDPVVSSGVVGIVALTVGLVFYRLRLIGRTQRSEDRAVSWLTARDLL